MLRYYYNVHDSDLWKHLLRDLELNRSCSAVSMSCGETSDYGWVRLHHCHHHYRYQHHNSSTIFFLLPWNSVQFYPRYACRPLPSLATQSLASLVTQEGEHELLEEPVEERQEVSLLQLWESFVVWTCKVVKIWSLTPFEPGRELSLLGIILMLLLFLRCFQ